ncbi:hypothetical protein TWF281_004358 [Arthrobotrys megalospora]
MPSDKSSGYERNTHSSTYNPGYTFYPHPFASQNTGITPSYRDQYLRKFSSSIRDTPDWIEKSRDRKIFVQWVQKAHKQDFDDYGKKVLAWNAEDVEFAWDELSVYREYVEKLRGKGCKVEPDIDGVWRADGIISEEVKNDLIDAVATLENVPDTEKNWRPNSGEQILDLVDPSLWPAIYGRTLDQTTGDLLEVTPDAFRIPFCFRQMGVTEIHPSINSEKELKAGYSKSFCWLPSEFKVSKDGQETKISSYINNLNSFEQRGAFYPILEKIFTELIPLFDHALADLHRGGYYKARARGCNKLAREDKGNAAMASKAILKTDYFKKFKEIMTQFQNEEEPTVKYSDSAVDVCYRHHKCSKERSGCDKISHRRISVPMHNLEPPLDPKDMWRPPKLPRPRALRLEGRTLKVIVKMTNIILTPEKPNFIEPYDWCIEPMLNESIVATGVYYYAEENISRTGLKFKLVKRGQYTPGCHCGANDISNDRAQKVVTQEDRAIVFPNMLQHKQQSFHLVDQQKPGYQKMLIFYLCDPSRAHEMPTTRTVTPQQPQARPEFVDELREGPLGALPEEVFQMILDQLPPPISKEEAEEYRQELLDERRAFYRSSKLVDK